MQPDFTKAFIDGRSIETEGRMVDFKIHQIGDLAVSSGYIVACDPFVFFDTIPFTTQIPIGTYSIILSIVHLDDDQRVAYAKLHISNEPAVKWEMALLPNQDKSSLKEDGFFGYPVDAGVGCFMDAEAAEVYLKKLGDEAYKGEYSYTDFLMTEMEKNYVHTWDWGNFKLDESKGNLIAFTSGLGDGSYPSYFGFDINDNVTSLITDFLVIDDKEVYSEAKRDFQ